MATLYRASGLIGINAIEFWIEFVPLNSNPHEDELIFYLGTSDSPKRVAIGRVAKGSWEKTLTNDNSTSPIIPGVAFGIDPELQFANVGGPKSFPANPVGLAVKYCRLETANLERRLVWARITERE